MDVEGEWKKFMIKNRKWDSKKGEWKFLKLNEYHNRLKTVPIKLKREDGSEYTSYQQVFDGWEMGPHLFFYCQLCGKDLKEMRQDGSNVIKFCCKDHSIEYAKRNKIRKDRFGEEDTGFSWHTDKGKRVFRKDIAVNILKNNEHKSFPLNARKSKWV